MKRMIIDTDTAFDDAVALLMALRNASVSVEAITVVAGNVPLEQGVQNALYTVDLVSATVPVYAGHARPLLEPLHTAQDLHGKDGMGDIGLDLSGRKPAEGFAVQVLIDLIRRSPGEITLVTLGPLTNIAIAFRQAPDLPEKLAKLVMMGGASDAVGNMTAVAEFNVWVDPEAAAIVLASGAPIQMVGWDIARRWAMFGREESRQLAGLGPLGQFAVDIQQPVVPHSCEDDEYEFDLPDPIAMAIAIDSTVATSTQRLFVGVETSGVHTRGQTVVDHLGVLGHEKQVDVVLEASRERFLELLTQALSP